jgi:hypothetical protein
MFSAMRPSLHPPVVFLGVWLSARAVGRRVRAAGALVAVVAGALIAVAPAHATVTPATGGRFSSFAIAFPAQRVALDLQFVVPRGCGELDDLHISIRRAGRGRFRFGPRVPGARTRRDGRLVSRWCRGSYRVSVLARAEFEPTSAKVIATGDFTVR